jgi:hypothetical protein
MNKYEKLNGVFMQTDHNTDRLLDTIYTIDKTNQIKNKYILNIETKDSLLTLDFRTKKLGTKY